MALTLDEIAGGRFRLGIGVSHQVTVEGMWGLKLVHPVEAMREYFGIVRSIVTTGAVSAEGEQFTARTPYTAPRREDMPILHSDLSPRMLELAGELAAGVSLWMGAHDNNRHMGAQTVRRGRDRAGHGKRGDEADEACDMARGQRDAGASLAMQDTRSDAALGAMLDKIRAGLADLRPTPRYRLKELLARVPAEGLHIDREFDAAPPVGREAV